MELTTIIKKNPRLEKKRPHLHHHDDDTEVVITASPLTVPIIASPQPAPCSQLHSSSSMLHYSATKVHADENPLLASSSHDSPPHSQSSTAPASSVIASGVERMDRVPPVKKLELTNYGSVATPCPIVPVKRYRDPKKLPKANSTSPVATAAPRKPPPRAAPNTQKREVVLKTMPASAPGLPANAHKGTEGSPEPEVARRAPRQANNAGGTSAASPSPSPPAAAAANLQAGSPSLKKSWSPPSQDVPLPTDEPSVLCPAKKYVYDLVSSQWKECPTLVRVQHPNRGVGQGGMRVCFAVEELDEEGAGTDMVAKLFRRNVTHVIEKDYFNEGEAQCMCLAFAENFNKLPAKGGESKPNISFLQCHVVRIEKQYIPDIYQQTRTGFFSYKTEDTHDILFIMEPKLRGNFTKYTNNFGGIYTTNETKLDDGEEAKRFRVLEAAEAFSHFTLVESGGSMLVCDLQGVNDFLTDPQIHTEDGKGLGMGNMGQRGIDKWVEKHKCNQICAAVSMQPLDEDVQRLLRSSKKDNYYCLLAAQLRDQSPVRPQDLIPLPKPLAEMTDEERVDYAVRLSQLLGE